MLNRRPFSKTAAVAFGFVASSLVATQCGTSPSEQKVQKRAQSPAPILLLQAFEKASEEHDLDLLAEVAFVQAHAGEVSSALQTIRSAKSVEWRNRRFADLSNSLSATGDIARAIQVTSAIDDTSLVKKETLSKIAQAQANAGEVSSALETARQLSGYLKADVMEAVALRQVKANDIHDAFKTLASIDVPGDVARRSRILIAIAARTAAANRMADALNAVALVDDKWKATAISEVAQSLAHQKRFIRATRIANSIESDAYTKTVAFNKIAEVSETLGDRLGGEKIRYHAAQLASTIPDSEYKNLALRAIAESAAESHDWGSALQAAAQVNDDSHRILALTSIAKAQRDSGFRDASLATVASANEVLRSAQDSGAADNARFWIVGMYVRLGDLPAAIAAATPLADSKSINQCLAFSELAIAQGASGDAAGAVRSINSIHLESPNGLVSCTKEGSRKDAVEGAVRAGHLVAGMHIAQTGPEQCYIDRSIASGLVRVGDVHGSARWTYTRGSKVMEGCALLGMAEGILNKSAEVR